MNFNCKNYEDTRVFVRDWLNKLEVDQFRNSSVLDCLTAIKVRLHDDQTSSDAALKLLSLLKSIFMNAQLDWLSSSYSKASVHEILVTFDPELWLLFLTGLLHDFNPGSRLDFVVGLLEQYFLHGSFTALVLQKSRISFQMSGLTWNKIISSISSLPDHIANKFESRISFPLFHHERFFVFIGNELCQILINLVEIMQENKDIDTTFLANIISQLCILGKCEYIFKLLFPFLIAKTHSCFLWQRVIQKVFCKCTDRSLDKLLLYIFKHAPTSFCLPRILGDLVVSNSKAKFIVLHKLLLTHHSSECTVARNVIGYVAMSSSPHFLYEVLTKLLSAWSSVSAIKHTSYEQHRYLTAAILACTAHLNDEFENRYKTEVMRTFMEGVKNHLESPDTKFRVLGMIVAEKLSELVKVSDQKEKLTFEYDKTNDVEFLLSFTSADKEPNENFYKKQMKDYENSKSKLENLSFSHSETSYGVDKNSFVKMAESQKINLHPTDGDKEPDSIPVIDLSSDTDSDDDLVPYDMPEEKPFSKVSKPMYIRDCLDGLIENKDREHMEIYLKCVGELVENDRFAAREIAVELCKVLMNLQDNYAIEGFPSQRRKAVVALLICDPKSPASFETSRKVTSEGLVRDLVVARGCFPRMRNDSKSKVAAFLTDEFYSEHYNLQQRMDILDALVMASGRISGLEKTEIKSQSLVEEAQSEANRSLHWQQVIDKRIESKTRRFGKVRKAVETSPDQFGPVAGYFFYPLMAGYDRRIRTLDLLGTDSMVLGRLLYALGTILCSATNSMVVEDMAVALLQFTAQLRNHSEAFVRKGCVYCLTMVTLSVRSLTQRLGDAALDARDWLCDVLNRDDDTQARQMASSCLALMSSKVRDELSAEG